MDMIALGAAGVVAALCAVVVRQKTPEIAVVLVAAACVLLLWNTLPLLETIRDVMEELAFLDMPGVSLEVAMEPVPLGTGGGDRVEFLIAANPGEPPKPIARIASGGELSRIMLAIKTVLADRDEIDTLIFDEIDTGISGRAARKVGIKLRQTAASRQVLCVTHLAQIASLAHHHLLISKTVREGRTYTEVTPLNREARERELARIIGGEVTGPALEAAREMLEKAAGESAEG